MRLMRYSHEELIHILGEKELNQIITEYKLKRAVDPGNKSLIKGIENEYGFNHLVAYSIYRLAFPPPIPPENYTLRERK